MKTEAVTWQAPGVVKFGKVELPEPGPDEVLIESAFSLVSPGTEKEWLASDQSHVVLGTTFPFVPGYSVAGTISAIGDGVRNWSVGDRVVASPIVGAHAAHVLASSDLVFAVADNVSFADAVFFNLGMTAAHTLSLSGARLGDSVTIVGQGPIGYLATQIAKAYGAWPIAVLELESERRRTALEVGATHAVDPRNPEDMAELIDALGGGSTVSIDLSGSTNGLATAISATAPLGTVILSTGMNASLEIPYGEVFIKGLTLRGGFVNARPEQSAKDTRQFLELLSREVVSVPEAAMFDPRDAVEVYERVLAGSKDAATPAFVWNQSVV